MQLQIPAPPPRMRYFLLRCPAVHFSKKKKKKVQIVKSAQYKENSGHWPWDIAVELLLRGFTVLDSVLTEVRVKHLQYGEIRSGIQKQADEEKKKKLLKAGLERSTCVRVKEVQWRMAGKHGVRYRNTKDWLYLCWSFLLLFLKKGYFKLKWLSMLTEKAILKEMHVFKGLI